MTSRRSVESTAPRAAIFDVDRTLLDGMSGYLFSRHLLARANLSAGAKLRMAFAVARYRLGLAPEEVIVEIGVTIYAGKRVEDLRRHARDCVSQDLAGRCYAEALERIRAHREQGDAVILASGSSDLVVGALAEHVGAAGFVATRAAVREGRSTREIVYPLCFRDGKRELVERLLSERGLALADAALYTDNIADLPLLERVRMPVAVNPHPELERIARERGWPIMAWTTPVDPRVSFSGTSYPLRGV